MSAGLPVFTPRAIPQERDSWGDLELPLAKWPRCRLCPETGPVDDASGLGVECWRVLVALPIVLEERRANPSVTVEAGS